jgi:hypothetical protein
VNRRFPHLPKRLLRCVWSCRAIVGVFLLTCVPLRLWAAPAEVPSNRRVLLIVDMPSDPFIERIRAEITSLGFVAVARGPVGPLETGAREQHAIAAVRVLASRKGVEVWMADETSGRSLLRQVVVDESPDGPDQSLVALQTAELLRTSIFPKRDKAPPPNATPVTTSRSPAELAPQPSSGEIGAQAGLGLLHSPGGVGSTLQIWLSLHHCWGRRMGVALDFSGPVRQATVSGPEGTAEVGVYLVAGEIFARFEANGSGLFLTAGLGAAVVRVSAKGQAEPSLVSTSAATLTGAGFARVDAGWQPSRWLRLGVSVLAGATPERVTVRFAGNEAGKWGWPFLAALALAEVDWR